MERWAPDARLCANSLGHYHIAVNQESQNNVAVLVLDLDQVQIPVQPQSFLRGLGSLFPLSQFHLPRVALSPGDPDGTQSKGYDTARTWELASTCRQCLSLSATCSSPAQRHSTLIRGPSVHMRACTCAQRVPKSAFKHSK